MTDDRRQIDLLLERVADERLRAQLRSAIETLSEEQTLGLVFEEHKPEAVRLPGSPVRRGVTVQDVDGRDDTIWDVTRIRQGKANLARVLPDGTPEKRSDVPVAELIVARRLGDPVYPGLRQLETISQGGDKPHHLVIEGENFHALQTLLYTHAGKVDLIYIDPPYNTGNGGWIYNDKYVGDADAYRHSKWLSFMHRRLVLARELLAPTGVIIVAIDDNEHHRLRMLMDQVFGEKNFLANITWQGNVKNDARFTGGGIDYMVTYARAKVQLVEADTRWKQPREGAADVLAAGATAWRKAAGDTAVADRELAAWWSKRRSDFSSGLAEYKFIDADGAVYAKNRTVDFPGGGGPMYEVRHPVTGNVIKPPSNGWRAPEETMKRWIAEGIVIFDESDQKLPTVKRRLEENLLEVASPTFRSDRRGAANRLAKILGGKDFPYPKDLEVISRWIDIATTGKTDAVVLDFFAGTGTTAEAVMRLNAADNGRRQSIVVTNNELAEKTAKKLTKAGVSRGSETWEAEGVFQKVTRPRIETVVRGIRRDGTKYSEGFEENVAFLKLDYLDRDDVEAGVAFRQVAELLWAKAGAVGPIIAERADDFSMTDHYAVCFDADHFTTFVDAVNAAPDVLFAYIVAPSEVAYGTVKRALRDDVHTVHLYENYLTNFEINTGAGR